jgi:acyl phosphate:glycerol-3-phosphate acyltransferase
VIWPNLLWAAGAYLAGTFPSTLLVARGKRARGLEAASGRSAGETDPHMLMVSYLGVGWTVVAATLDVGKGLVYLLAARRWGRLDDGWLAACGAAVVVGHSFPFYAKEMAGRGLAGAAGVYLMLLPLEMVVAGVLIVAGGVGRTTGLATTVAMALVPVAAAVQGQPEQFVAMSAAVFFILMIRRLEGVGDVIRSGVGPGRAVLYRCLFDSSGPPPGRGVWDRTEAPGDRPESPC